MTQNNKNNQKESELEQKALTLFTSFVIFLGCVGFLLSPPKACSQQVKDKKTPTNSKVIKTKTPSNIKYKNKGFYNGYTR